MTDYIQAFKLHIPLELIRTAFSRVFFAAIRLTVSAAIMSKEINWGKWQNTEEINSKPVRHM